MMKRWCRRPRGPPGDRKHGAWREVLLRSRVPGVRTTGIARTTGPEGHAPPIQGRNLMPNRIPIRSALSLKAALAVATLALIGAMSPAQVAGRNLNPGISPPNSTPHGKTYAKWSALQWQQAIEAPVAGNPFTEGGCYPLSGAVFALAAPIGVSEPSCTIPTGKALFVPVLTTECSSLEPPPFHGDTEAEQRECAKFWADHFVDLSVEIDGAPVNSLTSYRVVSPQFTFTAPDPNILGVAGGGPGTGVADGYYLMLVPPSRGEHTIRVRGSIHLSVAEGHPFDFDLTDDVTFHLTVR